MDTDRMSGVCIKVQLEMLEAQFLNNTGLWEVPGNFKSMLNDLNRLIKGSRFKGITVTSKDRIKAADVLLQIIIKSAQDGKESVLSSNNACDACEVLISAINGKKLPQDAKARLGLELVENLTGKEHLRVIWKHFECLARPRYFDLLERIKGGEDIPRAVRELARERANHLANNMLPIVNNPYENWGHKFWDDEFVSALRVIEGGDYSNDVREYASNKLRTMGKKTQDASGSLKPHAREPAHLQERAFFRGPRSVINGEMLRATRSHAPRLQNMARLA